MTTNTRHSSHWSTLALITLTVILFVILIVASLTPKSPPEPAYMLGMDGAEPRAAARGAGSYALSGYRWNSTSITYSVDNCPQSLDCAAAQQAVREAAAAWDAVANISLVEVPAGGDISVSWAQSGYGGRHGFDARGGKVAQTYYPYTSGQLWYDGDVVLDDAETWVIGSPAPFPQQVHLTSVVMHELGHSLGLAHSPDRGALMWPYYAGVRGLSAHDIAGIQALYGAPSAASH